MASRSASLQQRRLLHEAKAKELGQQLDSFMSRIDVQNEDNLANELDVLLKQLESKDSRIGSLESQLETKSAKIQELIGQMEALGQELDASYRDTLKSLQSGDAAITDDRKQLEERLAHMEALMNESKRVTAGSDPGESSYIMAELQGQLSVSSNLTDFLQEHLSKAEDEKRVVIQEKVKLQSQIMELSQMQKIRDDKIIMLEKKNLDQAKQIVQLATQLADLQENKNRVSGNAQEAKEEGFIEHLRFMARSAEEERDVLVQKLTEKEHVLSETTATLQETMTNVNRLESSIQEQACVKNQLMREIETLQSTLVVKESELQSLQNAALSSESHITSLTTENTSLQNKLQVTEEELVKSKTSLSSVQETLAEKQTALVILQSRLDALDDKIREKELELTTSMEQANTLSQSLEKRNQQLKQVEEHFARVSKEAQDASSALEEAKSSSKLIEEKIQKLENTIADLNDQLQDANSLLTKTEARREEEREQLTAQIQDLIEQLSEKTAMLQESENEIQQLRTQQEEAQATKVSLENELSNCKYQLEVSTARIDEITNETSVEKEKLVNDILALESRLVEIDQVAGLAKQALEQALNDKEAADAKVNELEEQLSEAKPIETPIANQEMSEKIKDLLAQLEVSNGEALVSQAKLLEVKEELDSAEQKSLELEQQLSLLNEKFKQAEMDNEAPALQRLVNKLESNVLELQATLKAAEEENAVSREAFAKALEEKALQDHSIQLFQDQVGFLQKQLEELESEPHNSNDAISVLESKISQMTELLAEREIELSSSREERTSLLQELIQAQDREKSLEAQLDASKSELEQYIMKHAEEAFIYQEQGEKCAALEAELESFQLRVSTLETALAEMNNTPSTSNNQINEIKEEKQKNESDLKRQIHDLDLRLSESTKEVQLLRVNLNQSLELRSAHAARLDELTGQLELFHSRLHEKEQVIAGKDKCIKEQAAKMEELIAHIAEVESQLAESDKVTRFSRTCSNRLEEEKRLNEARSQKKIVEMEDQLAETGRQLETLQTTISFIEEEKRELRDKRKELESKLNNLNMLLRLKEEEIEVRDRTNRDHAMKVEDLLRQLADVEGRLQVSNQVAEFLQSCLTKADEENRLNESKWRKKIGELEIIIAETRRTSEVAILRAEEEKRLSETKAHDLVTSVEISLQKFLASHSRPSMELIPTLDISTPKVDPPRQKRQEVILAGVIPLAILAVWAGVTLPCVRPSRPPHSPSSAHTQPILIKASPINPESKGWQNKTPAPGPSTSSPDCLETVTTFFRPPAMKEPVVEEVSPPPKSSFWWVSPAKSFEKLDVKHIGNIHRTVTDLLSESLMTNQYN